MAGWASRQPCIDPPTILGAQSNRSSQRPNLLFRGQRGRILMISEAGGDHVCMYCHTYSRRMDQPSKVVNPVRGQLSRDDIYFPCLRSRLRIWSRVNLLISILILNLVLTYGIPPEFRRGVHLFMYNRHTPSGQSRVHRVTQLRTDDVHYRESAGTGPV